MENARIALQNARRHKEGYHEVKLISGNEDEILSAIVDSLIKKEYKTTKYINKIIHERTKDREISKLPFIPDRIVHWMIMQTIGDRMEKVFVNDTHATIPFRGIHSARKQVDTYLYEHPEETTYCLKIDIKHFFYNIRHDILKHLLKSIISDVNMLQLLDEVIDSNGSYIGVPIGNYCSQYFANFYLSYFDHWLKETLHVKYYIRYMDDIVILNNNKEELWRLLNKMRNYLKDNLMLEIKENYCVFPVAKRGIDFVGYRNFGYQTSYNKNKVILRKTTWKSLRRKMLRLDKTVREHGIEALTYSDYCSYNSYKGWVKNYCSNKTIYEFYINKLKIPMRVYYHANVTNRPYDAEKAIKLYDAYRYYQNGNTEILFKVFKELNCDKSKYESDALVYMHDTFSLLPIEKYDNILYTKEEINQYFTLLDNKEYDLAKLMCYIERGDNLDKLIINYPKYKHFIPKKFRCKYYLNRHITPEQKFKI